RVKAHSCLHISPNATEHDNHSLHHTIRPPHCLSTTLYLPHCSSTTLFVHYTVRPPHYSFTILFVYYTIRPLHYSFITLFLYHTIPTMFEAGNDRAGFPPADVDKMIAGCRDFTT
ncbi:hypothetical protein GGTG_09540, partial [Gaeumannomyces tritici R3-111a-1]